MDPDQINEILDIFAERLGPMGTHIWEVFVRQQIISWWTGFSTALIMAPLGTALLAWGIKKVRPYWSQDDAPTSAWIALVLAVIGGIFTAVGTMGLIVAVFTVTQLFNPEYYAILDLLGRGE